MTPADWPYVVSVTCHKHKKVPTKVSDGAQFNLIIIVSNVNLNVTILCIYITFMFKKKTANVCVFERVVLLENWKIVSVRRPNMR